MNTQLNKNSNLVTTTLQGYTDNGKYIISNKNDATETNSDWGAMEVGGIIRHIGWRSLDIGLEFGHVINTDQMPFESQRLYIIGPYTDSEKRLTTLTLSHNESGPPTNVLEIPIVGMDNNQDNILAVLDIILAEDKSTVKFRSLPLHEGDTSNISESYSSSIAFSIPIRTVSTGGYSAIIPLEMNAVAIRKLSVAEYTPTIASIDVDEEESNPLDQDNSDVYNRIKADLDILTVITSRSNTAIQELESKLEEISYAAGRSEMELQASGRYEALSAIVKKLSEDVKTLDDRSSTISKDLFSNMVKTKETRNLCTSISQAVDNLSNSCNTDTSRVMSAITETQGICSTMSQNVDKLYTMYDENGSVNSEDNSKALLYCILVTVGIQLLLSIFNRNKAR